MPRAPITITIVTSRLALLAQGLAALGVVVVLARHAPGWATLLAAGLLVAVVADAARRRPQGVLRCEPREGAAPLATWRGEVGMAWQDMPLRCDYLGPWLIGLRLAERRLWLWPDSADPEALRQLRKVLHSLP
ncbi:hypothetical protein [Halomonas borealis]|uniref:hypothetical protein n=1 Tax=Halomonas borealis TaxID=2508710 RepID=UPI0010A09A98|nr:hypothetical protein [Halomonas borealis]